MEEEVIMPIQIRMTVSPKIQPVHNKLHIRWEEDIIKIITCHDFEFAMLTMEQAVNKVSQLIKLHSDDYFSYVSIKPYSI